MNNKIYLQITSGRGPAECCRVVALLSEQIIQEAKRQGLSAEIRECEEGDLPRTFSSLTLSLEGADLSAFIKEWQGSVLWIAQSPYRPYHKRKNWFVGVNILHIPDMEYVNQNDFNFQTLRSSGPGGQHVNKTESAVRATHLPTGLSVTASDQRSQLQNKRLAIERLLIILAVKESELQTDIAQKNWNNHNNLQRGNPVKVIKKALR